LEDQKFINIYDTVKIYVEIYGARDYST